MTSPSTIAKIVEELASFDDFCVGHVRRAGNVKSNTLSKWALTFREVGEMRTKDLRHVELEDLVF